MEKDKKQIEKFSELRPLRMEDNSGIHIILSSDTNYEPHLWVTISSIIDTAKSKSNYYIYILDGGIKNKDAFYSLISKDKRFHIQFIDMSNQFLTSFESRHVSKAAYYRLSIFKLFKDFEKVIYIDADSYVLSDIAELYDLNITEGKGNGKHNRAIEIDIPKIVCLTPYTIADGESPKGRVGEAESVLTHIRNSFAHGNTYFFENGNVLFEDKDMKGIITARIILKQQTLLDWISLIDKEQKFYVLHSVSDD